MIEEIIRKLIEQNKDYSNTKLSENEIIEKINNFLSEHLYNLILDNLIFSKEEKIYWLKEIDREIENLKVIISYPWMYNKVKVAFAGRFSSGKSSMINALLDTDTLPTDITPTTAIPTHITHIPNAETNTAYAINREGKLMSIPIELFKEIKHGNINETYGAILQVLVDSVVINYQSDLLTKIIIIDTPGYDPSSSNIDRELSLKALKSSDLIFWVVDIEDGNISNDALNKIIKKELVDKNFSVIVNKVDRKPPSAHSKVKDKIEETLRKASINFRNIFLFSSKEKDKYLSEVLDFIHKALQDETNNLPFIYKVRGCIENISDKIINCSKKITNEKDTEREKCEAYLKYLRQNYKNKLDKILKNTFYQYADLKKPYVLSGPYYKVDEDKVEDYLETLSKKVLNSVDKFINELLSEYFKLNNLNNLNKEEEIEKILKQSRRALKQLEILEEEIERNIINNIIGGKNNGERAV